MSKHKLGSHYAKHEKPKPNDHVALAIDYMGGQITGRVVSLAFAGQTQDPRLMIWTVLLDHPLDNYEWPGMSVPGAQLRKLSVLESLALAASEE